MKGIILLFVTIMMAFGEETYDTNNDNFNIDALVADKTALQAFTDCFIRDTNCDEISTDFKKDLKEAYELACSKCTQAQKHIMNIYLQGLKQKLPEQYVIFKNKYDPEGKFSSALEAAIGSA